MLEQITDSDEALFKVTYTDIDKAEEMLKSEDIKGIIKASDLSLEFGSTGIQQTIVKTFIQQYKTQEKIITDTAKNAPQKLDKVIASLSEKIYFPPTGSSTTHRAIYSGSSAGKNPMKLITYFP